MTTPTSNTPARLTQAAVHRLTLSTDPWLSCEREMSSPSMPNREIYPSI